MHVRVVPPTLRLGKSGADVRTLQSLLNQRLQPVPRLEISGRFDERTELFVRRFQSATGLESDGVCGRNTWNALSAPAMQTPAPAVPDDTAVQSDPPWMRIALREVGQREIAGAHHNPRIVEYHASTLLRARTDEVPWCASFVNWCVREAGFKGTNSAAAASWARWGVPCEARRGAIAVIYNSTARNSSLSTTGHHVGFLMHETPTHLELLGGNQADSVKVSRYARTSWTLKAYRWAPEAAQPAPTE